MSHLSTVKRAKNIRIDVRLIDLSRTSQSIILLREKILQILDKKEAKFINHQMIYHQKKKKRNK